MNLHSMPSRLIRSVLSTRVPFAITTSPTIIAGPDPCRVAVVVSPCQTSRINLSFGNNPAVNDNDFGLGPNSQAQTIRREDIGGLIAEDIRVISGGADSSHLIVSRARSEQDIMDAEQQSHYIATHGFGVSFSAGLSPSIIAGPDPLRVAVLFNSNAGQKLGFAFGYDPSLADCDVFLAANTLPVVIRREDIGALIEQDIRVIASAAAQTGRITIGKRVTY